MHSSSSSVTDTATSGPLLPELDAWLAWFQRNAKDVDGIPWHAMDALTDQEQRRIRDSIAKFQLGEYSEGSGLMKFAAEFAKSDANRTLPQITRLFVREEQNHALMLKRFMEAHGIRVIRKNWTDSVFRRLRRNVGYELSITVLITAEIIALVYYVALSKCTGSPVLKAICAKVLRDESAHVRYESQIINHIHSNKSGVRRYVARFLHRCLFCGTVMVVAIDHRKVIRAGGFNSLGFWHACWREFSDCFGRASCT